MRFLNVIFNTLIGLIVSVYVLISKERFIASGKKCIYAIFQPDRSNGFLRILRKSHEIFIGFITGRIICAVIFALIIFVMMLIFKMPYALIVCMLCGVMILIPFFGQFVAVFGGTAIVMLDSPGKGVVFLIMIVILTQINGNIIEPKVVGDSVGLPPFWIIVAILLGEGLFGWIGVFAGVPIFAIIMYIAGELIDRRLKIKHLPQEPSEYLYVEKYDEKTGELIKRQVEEPEVVPEEIEGPELEDENTK